MPSHRREQKTVELSSDDEADHSDLGKYLEEAASRLTEERIHGTRKLHELVVAGVRFPEESVDAVLDIARGCVDDRRSVEERIQLVDIACFIMLYGDGHETFAADFGEVVGMAVLNLLHNEEASDLVVRMLHAVVLAQTLESNSIKLNPGGKRLAELMLEELDKDHSLAMDIDMALARCVVTTAHHEDDEHFVREALGKRLQKYQENMEALCGVVRSFALCAEAFGTCDVITPSQIEPLEEISAKLPGGKEKRKELSALVRDVVKYMRTGEGPWTTLTLQNAQRGDPIEVPLESFHDLNVVESVRAVLGDKYYDTIRDSELLRAHFGHGADDELELAPHARIQEKSQKARLERFNRLRSGRDRERGIARARDRKYQQ